MRRCSQLLLVFASCFLLFNRAFVQAQTLQVSLSPDRSKVDRSTSDGVATIFFESSIKDLSVVCTEQRPDEPINKIGEKVWFIHVDPKSDIELDGLCYRIFLLKCPASAEYYLTTPEIGYNQVLYYTVVLPNQFVPTVSAECLFSKTSKYGFRLSYGKRFGGYVSYKWGDYKAMGENIANYQMDCDVTQAECIGEIRTAITAGVRLGLYKGDNMASHNAVYLLIGGGYGEYGRQWNNPYLVGESSYFYSDYVKGFDGEVAIQFLLFDWLCCSFGADMVVDRGKITTDYQLGIGINLCIDKFSNRKYSVR